MSLTELERHRVRALLGDQSEVAASRTEHADTVAAPMGDGDRQPVQVVGAHPWAGASAVALAMADAATRRHDRVVLVDRADRESSGLVAVTDRELGQGRDGWSMALRGSVEVRRATAPHVTPPLLVPPPPDAVVVVDRGRCVVDQLGRLADVDDGSRLVLVCRATIPGVRAAEVALSRLGRGDILLAVVGARRLAGVVAASAGPGVTRLLDQRRVVCFPHVRRLEVEGLDDRPLPGALLASAGRVWGALPVAATAGDRELGER